MALPRLRVPSRVRVAFQNWQDARRGRRLRRKVHARNFSIIACNCWGAEIYRDLKIPYLTPFVGLYLNPPCFVGFLENFQEAVRSPLEFVDESRYKGRVNYPVGLILDQYEIHFLHYESVGEAREKWKRRCARIAPDLDDCFFMSYEMFDNQGGNYPEEMRRFARLPFRNKVFFAARLLPEVPKAVVVPTRDGAITLEDGPRLYRRCHGFFDVAGWLNKKD